MNYKYEKKIVWSDPFKRTRHQWPAPPLSHLASFNSTIRVDIFLKVLHKNPYKTYYYIKNTQNIYIYYFPKAIQPKSMAFSFKQMKKKIDVIAPSKVWQYDQPLLTSNWNILLLSLQCGVSVEKGVMLLNNSFQKTDRKKCRGDRNVDKTADFKIYSAGVLNVHFYVCKGIDFSFTPLPLSVLFSHHMVVCY